MKRTGIISKCQALGSWIIIARNDDRYYTLPLSKESIEPYVSLQNGTLVHQYEGKSVPFILKSEREHFVGGRDKGRWRWQFILGTSGRWFRRMGSNC